MGDVWYYQYKVVLLNSSKDEDKEEIVNGIVPGMSFSDVVQKLEDFYGTELMNIITLKAVFEGEVFEFESVNDSVTDFEILII